MEISKKIDTWLIFTQNLPGKLEIHSQIPQLLQMGMQCLE